MTTTIQKDNQSVYSKQPVISFLFFWFAANIIQVSFTELTSDEGYYWFYAQHLQWGYYDHPPMLAAMIKAGNELLGAELGVRFFNVVLSTAGLWLFFSLLPEQYKNTRKTFLLLLAAPLLHYLTFLVFPDGPLLFFSVLFLVLYKHFLAKQRLSTAVSLGICLALMAYSKYHGALVLLFTTIANPKLLKSGYFYLMLLVAAVLFAPHLWWQYQNNFPTFRYHLSGRTEAWSFGHVGEYLSQQLIAIGPALIFLPIVAKTKDVFERTLKFIIIGTFLFFLISSFKTFVHFHWTSIAVYPLLYFGVSYYNQPQRRRLFNGLVLPFVVLFFLVRILLAVPLIPNMHVGEDYYHGRAEWAKEILMLAKDRPVFIPNNLREAPLYSFYSGQQGVTLYTRPEKKSQYELWNFEDSLQGKEVFYFSRDSHPASIKVTLTDRDFYYRVVPSFQSYYNGLTLTAVITAVNKESLKASLKISNETLKPIAFEKNSDNDYIGIAYAIEQNKRVVKSDAVLPLTKADNLNPKSTIVKTVIIPIQDLPAGKFGVSFGIRSGTLPDAILSKPTLLQH